MGTLYMDSTARSAAGGPIGVVAEAGETIIFAGTTVYAMEGRDNNPTYRGYALNQDVHFIFEDNVPVIDFYTVPRLDIFARDSRGGYLATCGEATGMESDAPICYVDKDRRCFAVAGSLRTFAAKLDAGLDWREDNKEIDGIVFYPSREDAMKALEFIQLPGSMLEVP